MEVSRTIVQALPGTQEQIAASKLFKIKGAMPRKMKEKRFQCCGSFKHKEVSCQVDEEVRCFSCGEEGHLSYICQEEDQEEDQESGKDDEHSEEDEENQESDEDSTEVEEDDEAEAEEEEEDERFQIKDKKRGNRYKPVSRN